jgi:hypothetical protein
VTDENGIATAATFAANGLEGSYTVTATVSGVVTPANFLLTNFGWYVAQDGNNTNDCQTAATPCATVSDVLGKPGLTAGDTVLVATGTYTGTGDEVVLLDNSVRLLGGWNGTFTTQSGTSTIDGEAARRGITVNSVVTAIVERFTVQNGSDQGGIYNNQGTLILNNSTVSGNSGGGIYNSGTVTLNSSTVSNNTDRGISNSSSGNVTLNNSAVSNNIGLGIRNDGIMILNNSTVSSNTATGISNYNGFLVLNSSTVSSNTAQNSAGINNNNGFLVLNNSTVSNNTANGHGGGIRNQVGSVTLQNTILAGNTASGNGPDCNGNIDSSGYNLIGNTSGCTFSPSTGDFLNVDARLSPLIGSPGYHPLLSGSPAIDAGNPVGCTDHLDNPLDTDQRGAPRVGRCDIGAYEFGSFVGDITQVFLPIILRSY